MRRLILAAVMLQMACRPTFAEHGPDAEQHRQVVELGRGMDLIAPSLMQIGLETNFFLLLALLFAFVWRIPFLAGLAFMIAGVLCLIAGASFMATRSLFGVVKDQPQGVPAT